MKTCLVVLAAGMSSRFGGLKQLQSLTSDGKVLLDFSIDDAIEVGFDKVVFIIRREMEEQFKQTLGNRTSQKIAVDYVFQPMTENRSKPLGTAHAILCCKNVVDAPFAVINADDYYGKSALKSVFDHLQNSTNCDSCLVCYKLANTLSKNGSVSRGVCELKNGYLKSIAEHKGINFDCNTENESFSKETPVSMNLWGFLPSIFPLLQSQLEKFLQTSDIHQDEFALSTAVNNLLQANQISVKAFETDEQWVGMTYLQDLPNVSQFVSKLKK